jgi:prepilin-type N-terminal cleavage/methylation domain-containing protein
MNSKGFSIAELVVTMGIIGIVSSVVFANYKQMGRQSYLTNQANELVSDIEEARSTALSATEMTEGGSQVEHFTITLNEDETVLFEGADNAEKRNYLGRGVVIKQNSGYKIGFKPPQPTITFWDSGGSEVNQDYIEFVLNYNTDEEEDVKVRINKAGLVWLVKN